MLKLSRKSEYGIIALKHISSSSPDHLTTAREISEKYQIPVELMAKILQGLTKAGLLKSIKGAHGGYSLAKGPDEISVKDVVNAIEGPIGLVECVVDHDNCTCVQHHLGICNIEEPFARIQFEFQKFLEGIKLVDLV